MSVPGGSGIDRHRSRTEVPRVVGLGVDGVEERGVGAALVSSHRLKRSIGSRCFHTSTSALTRYFVGSSEVVWARHPVGEGLDERRALAGARGIERVPWSRHTRQDVVAVDPHARGSRTRAPAARAAIRVCFSFGSEMAHWLFWQKKTTGRC
jgi:hypothetical protein